MIVTGNNVVHRSDGCNGCARLGRACARYVPEDWICNCEWHQTYAELKKKQIEVKMRKAAIEDPSFPDKDVSHISFILK